MGIATRISDWYFRHRYAILFYSLLTTIAFEPVAGTVIQHVPYTRALLGANLVLAVLSSMTGLLRRVLLVVALMVWLIQVPLSWFFTGDYSAERLTLWSVVAMLSAGSSVYYAARARRIDSQHLYAALSAYLIAGLFFGAVHHLIEEVAPGSYTIGGELLNGAFVIEDAIYYSFMTIATVGYGDILPKSEAARGIATVEALTGQLYLAVMIARIVSLYMPRRLAKRDEPE